MMKKITAILAIMTFVMVLLMSTSAAWAVSDEFIIGGPYIKDVHQYLEQFQHEESPVWYPPGSSDCTETTGETSPIVEPGSSDCSEPSGDSAVPDDSDSNRTAEDTLFKAVASAAGPSVDPYNPNEVSSGRYVDVPHLTPGVATTYNDTAGHWAEREIAAATRNGLMNGMGDGSFAPDEKVTLGQAITVYLRTCRFSETKIDVAYSDRFADVRGRDWLVAPIAIYAYLDPGYANKSRYDSYGNLIYDVDRPASREDVALMFGAGYKNWLDSNPGRTLSSSLNDIWQLSTDSQSRIAYLGVRGVINGYPDGSFRPNADITRAEFSAIANRAFTAGISDYYVLPKAK